MALISNGDQVLTKRVYNSDETVLWEGNATSAMLSESVSNFEYIKVSFNNGQVYIVNSDSAIISLHYMSSISSDGLYHTQDVNYTISGTSIAWAFAFHTWRKSGTINTEARSEALSPAIKKVIGINRKEVN